MEDPRMKGDAPESGENPEQGKESQGNMSRRSFLKKMAGAFGAAAMGKLGTACGPPGLGREGAEGCKPGPNSGMNKEGGPEGCKPGPEGCKPGPEGCKPGPEGCKPGPEGCKPGPEGCKPGPEGCKTP